MNAGSQLNTNGFNFVFTSTSGFSLTGATITNPVAANTSDFNIPGGGSSINGCTFNGNFSFQKTSPNQTFNEANTTANTWNGNFTLTVGLREFISLSEGAASAYNGNVTVVRLNEDNGTNQMFRAGGVIIQGNFSYTNPQGGILRLGTNSADTRIIGTFAINAQAPAGSGTSLAFYRVKNETNGGSVSLSSITTSNIEGDSLNVNSFAIYGDGQLSLTDNYIKGTTTLNNITYLDNNIFDGDIVVEDTTTLVSNQIFYDAFNTPNIYLGNASFKSVNGSGRISYSDTSVFHKNVVINGTNITVNGLKYAGNINSNFSTTGNPSPIAIGRIIMEKTGGARLTLNNPVSITSSVRFTSGNIYTTASSALRFNNLINHTGASLTSHVVGVVEKLGAVAASVPFTFPTGTAISYNPVTKSNSATATDLYSAEYVLQNPSSDGLNTNNKAASLTNISKAGYWNVQRLAGTANVTITLGFATNPYEQYPIIANLKVAYWNGSQWDDKGTASPTGDPTLGSITNSTGLTAYGFFALANMTPTYFYNYSNPGTGPDGTPVKVKAIGGWPAYQTKQLPAGTYSTDSIYLVPNATAASFKLKDFYNVEKDDTTINAPTAPTTYISANGNGTVNFTGWRHFVYMIDGSNNMMGAIRDNDLTLGNTTMNTYFSTPNVATAPNGNIFLKRSFKITSQFAPAGTKRVRLYVSKTEFTNLVAADPTSFPSGINNLTITKYAGPQEDSLFNPIPGGNAVIIPNSDITIADLGTMYSLDIDVAGFSGFYIGGNQSNVNICSGSTISLPSNINGTTYQWQVDNGGGYTNISNTGVYSGATTKSLTLSNTPGTMYGYKFRCFVNGSTYSQEYTLKFTAEWEGTVSNVWANTANWSCGILPDANTDVILNAGKPNFPQLSTNTTIRSLRVNTGATVTVKAGFNLTILK
jgi:hypothetical protein